MPDLLYEIGVEELPAGYIGPALAQLRDAVGREFDDARLARGEVRVTGTPRRLVLAVAHVAERQPDAEQDVSGPPVKAAFDADGNPTKAALGFAKSQGVEVGAIEQRETPRGTYCFVRKSVVGRPAAEIVAEALPRITAALSFPKSMLWPGGERPFARPVRRLLALLGGDVIPFELFGLRTGRTTEGHPILAPGPIEIQDADFDSYEARLRNHFVIVDIEERRDFIRTEIAAALQPFGGPFHEEGLLDEVTNLAQYPSVTLGAFRSEYLAVPAAVVEAAMMEHQRYFPVRTADGKLCPNFLVVSDRGPAPSDLVRAGNEQVLEARLADAQFFDRQDRKVALADRVPGLSGVAFLKGLGTYAEKTERLEKLARAVSEALGLDARTADHAARAARLCKADLLTEMVGEFPKLQGTVGSVYALRDGEPEPVARAIAEHYLPRSADGELPATPAGRALSLTEKLDNLTSCFALGLVPTGSADPYALRRQGQAALRIVEESESHPDLDALIRGALALLPEPRRAATDAVEKLMGFLRDRVRQMALDRGAPHDLIHAALAVGIRDVRDFWLRLDALRSLARDDGWQRLVIAVERTSNITRDAPEGREVDPALFQEPLEKELWSLFESNQGEVRRLQGERRYADASRRYAEVFSATLHQFFEDVFVNVDDETVRANRLQLLLRVNRLYTDRIADLSRIVTGVHV